MDHEQLQPQRTIRIRAFQKDKQPQNSASWTHSFARILDF